jgi:Helix-turn-helix domain
MHGSFDKRRFAKKQDATAVAPITLPAKARRASSQPKRALGPMTEPARLRVLDWFLHQVGVRTAERPPSYLSVASAFMMHFNDSDGTAYPSLETIAALCGLARRTIRDMVDLHLADDNIRIVEKGKQGRRHPTTYAIVIKPLPDDVAEARRRVALREDRRKRAANTTLVSHLNSPESADKKVTHKTF